MRIRPYETSDREAVVDLSLAAWDPVFVSLRRELDAAVFQYFFPDWRVCQRKAVEDACANPDAGVWVAQDDGGRVLGFTVAVLREPTFGEIHMLAVHPDSQRRGVGAALTERALAWMREKGVIVAMVETGGDEGHAPARRSYERSGFRLLPVARYFRKIG